MRNVGIFIDVQNIYYTVKQHFGSHFDYDAFWKEVSKQRRVETAIAYAIDRGDEKQRRFQNILRGIGFAVKLKPFIQRCDGSAKGDWDVGITIDVLHWAPRVDTVILVSGDGDFDLLVDTVRRDYGVAVEVYGVKTLTAESLISSASRFIPVSNKLLL